MYLRRRRLLEVGDTTDGSNNAVSEEEDGEYYPEGEGEVESSTAQTESPAANFANEQWKRLIAALEKLPSKSIQLL